MSTNRAEDGWQEKQVYRGYELPTPAEPGYMPGGQGFYHPIRGARPEWGLDAGDMVLIEPSERPVYGDLVLAVLTLTTVGPSAHHRLALGTLYRRADGRDWVGVPLPAEPDGMGALCADEVRVIGPAVAAYHGTLASYATGRVLPRTPAPPSATDVWVAEWVAKGRGEAPPSPPLAITPRLRFARWLVEQGRLSG